MARKTKSQTAVQKWDEELAKYAEAAVEQEASVASGQFFSVRGGQLSFDGVPIPNNRMAVIVIDSIIENVFYPGKYNPDEPQGPACFAFGRSEKDLAPDAMSSDPQSEQCIGCPRNEWGSSDMGRGKACRNTRRIALLPAGNLSDDGRLEELYDVEHFKTAQPGYMKLPVTSVKGFASYVKQIGAAMARPPFAIITRVSVIPDPKTQFKVVFEPLKEAPTELLGTLVTRHNEISGAIAFPYQSTDAQETTPVTTRRRTTKRAAKKTSSKKRRRY